MRAVDLILKKRNGGKLTTEEIEFMVQGYVRGAIPDYQISAFMMAVFFQDMDDEETTAFTMAMVDSGDKVDLSAIPGIKVDKHSTGGVGDTTTLVLAPLVAAAGLPVAKMSGRGLGHTGGTLDKLESIPGLSVDMDQERFIRQVQEIGVAVIGQTADLAPADKLMYSLRDVTGTVDSIPLIAGSIMSKKIAAGSDAILLDVKVGGGAFMTTIDLARRLAHSMVRIGTLAGRKMGAVISDMDQPLGTMIGNSLEVREAVEILRGEHREGALAKVSETLGAHLLVMGGMAENFHLGRTKIVSMLEKGDGAEKFRQMIQAQGGDPKVVDDTSRLPTARRQEEVKAPVEGYVRSIQARMVGEAAMLLGAGRATKADRIDPAVGLILHRRVGDWVDPGDVIATIHANHDERIGPSAAKILGAFQIDEEPPGEQVLIHDSIFA